MDINDYIASGVLELYVAGALTAEEERDVERMAAAHGEVRSEIGAIEEAFIVLAMTQATPPRSSLRTEVLAAVDATEGTRESRSVDIEREAGRGRSHGIVYTTPASASTPPPTPSDKRSLRLPPRYRYAMAASIAVAFVSTGLATYFAFQWDQAEEQLSSLVQENSLMVHERGVMKARLDGASTALAAFRRPGTRLVVLHGLAAAPTATAAVLWDTVSYAVRLDPGGLPPAPAGKQYQLWAIVAGKPVDAGLVGVRATWLMEMKDIRSAQAFAITLEPTGGSASPTTEAMYVLGTV